MASQTRRLAAIMFTDIVGYSAMASRDEAHALRMLGEHRAILRPIFDEFKGREIKTMADGFLVEFGSAVEAARCAISIQDGLSAHNASCDDDHRVQARIGIHLGDVVFSDSDVLGDGVNIASRIEQLAEPGGICVSEDVARQIRNKVAGQLESLGTPEMKNIEAKVEVFRLATKVTETSASARSDANSIAVLPFSNMSADPENEYFSDGLTEDILTNLSRIKSLKVISRTSVMQYKGTTKTVRQIGRELGVQTILEGSVRKAGNQVRISAQLIDSRNDEHLWAQNYDRELRDIFSVQSDVAERIVQALKAQITAGEEAKLWRHPTASIEAYEEYLRGRHFLAKRSEPALRKAIEHFERSIAIDPNYAVAYTGIADAYLVLSLFGIVPPRAALPKAKEAAEHALRLDGALAEAHASLGLVKFQFEWDFSGAEQELRSAIQLNPNYAPAHHYYADVLKALGRFEEALAEIRAASSLDPLSLAVGTGVGHVLYLSRRYDEAIEAYRRTVDLDPSFGQARLWFGRPFLEKGMYTEAIREMEEAVRITERSTVALAGLGHAYASSGQIEKAQAILDELFDRAKKEYVPAYSIALVYVGFDDKDKALDWFEKAFEERSTWLAWVNVEPRFDCLRGQERFKNLVRKIGF